MTPASMVSSLLTEDFLNQNWHAYAKCHSPRVICGCWCMKSLADQVYLFPLHEFTPKESTPRKVQPSCPDPLPPVSSSRPAPERYNDGSGPGLFPPASFWCDATPKRRMHSASVPSGYGVLKKMIRINWYIYDLICSYARMILSVRNIRFSV